MNKKKWKHLKKMLKNKELRLWRWKPIKAPLNMKLLMNFWNNLMQTNIQDNQRKKQNHDSLRALQYSIILPKSESDPMVDAHILV